MKDKIEIINFNMTKKSINDIETSEVDGGLLLKEVPVFKTGKHRDTDYTEKYIDNVLVGQFELKDNTPIQADHSESYQDTLGYVKGIVRKGEMMFADMLLLSDNAISRWKKGLMKKWSVGLYSDGRGLREISAVAFPYIKEASVLSEETDITPVAKSVDNKNKPTHELEKKDDKIVETNSDTNMDEEIKMEDLKKIEELAEIKAKEMLKEAGEREEKLTKELSEKTKETETLAEDKAKLEEKLNLSAIKETVSELKADGKVLPAEEVKVVDFMVTLSEEQRTEYVTMLKASEKKVDLEETGAQETKKEETEKDEYHVDFDEMEIDEIELIVEKYAKDNGVPEEDARDIIYDKYSKKEKE